MPTITIPKKMKQAEELIAIPRREYDELLSFKRLIPTFKPTRADLRALARGRKEFQEGKYVSWHELKRELAHLRSRSRKKQT